MGGAEGVEAVTVIPTVAVVIAGTFPEDRCVPGTEPSPFSPPPQLQERGMERWGVLLQHLGCERPPGDWEPAWKMSDPHHQAHLLETWANMYF